MNNKEIEITLPVYNEEKILKINAQRIIEYLEKEYKDQWHITIAENGSSDKTFRIAKELSNQNINVSVIQTKKGRGSAIKKSWQNSNSDYLIYMDIDLSTKPEEIPKLIKALEERDIAIGSRFLKDSQSKRTAVRKIISKIYNFLAGILLGLRIKDIQCGFKGLTKESKGILNNINDTHWFFDTELLYRAKMNKLTIKQVPISWNEREDKGRKSKVNIFLDSFYFLKKLIKLRFKKNIILSGLLVFLSTSGVFFLILANAPGALCPDSFYHAKISQSIWETKSLLFNFPWLPFTILGGDNFVDHHMLFHLISSPFIGIFGFYGFKIVIPLMCGFLFLTIYLILKKLKIKYPFLWLVIILLTPAFLYRIILYRAIAFAITLLLIGSYLIVKKKYIPLLSVSFIFVWSYNSFPLILLFSVLWTILEKIKNNKLNLKPIFYSAAGIFLGVIINPYFPQNLELFKIHLFIIPTMNGLISNYNVGAEWYPLSLVSMLKGMTVVWLLFCSTLALTIFNKKRGEKLTIETIFFIVISILLFLATIKSQRFAEYWIPFSVISFALAARDYNIWQHIHNFLKSRKPNLMHLLIISAAPIVYSVYVILLALSAATNTSNYQRIEKSTNWIKQNIPHNETIINISWSSFPELYFHNTDNKYVAGMDLMFLCSHDKEKCDAYNYFLDKEKIKKSQTNIIKNAKILNSKYIYVLNNKEVAQEIRNSNLVNTEYEEENIKIFKINE